LTLILAAEYDMISYSDLSVYFIFTTILLNDYERLDCMSLHCGHANYLRFKSL